MRVDLWKNGSYVGNIVHLEDGAGLRVDARPMGEGDALFRLLYEELDTYSSKIDVAYVRRNQQDSELVTLRKHSAEWLAFVALLELPRRGYRTVVDTDGMSDFNPPPRKVDRQEPGGIGDGGEYGGSPGGEGPPHKD
jgi:hypothetical protein